MFKIKFFIPALLIIIAALSGCFSPWQGDTAAITINLGAGTNARAVDYPPTPEILSQLEHSITMLGSTGPQDHSFPKGETKAAFSVAPGLWSITVEALLDGELYAAGSGSVDVIAGRNNAVSITMSRYDGSPVDIEGMVWVPGGSFQMGDTAGGGYNGELPVHTVTLTGFYMGKYEVT